MVLCYNKNNQIQRSMMQDIENTKSCLDRLLANSYVTLMLTQHVHWNATGETFFSIHKMTPVSYTHLTLPTT